MGKGAAEGASDPQEVRLFTEEICCELFRFGEAQRAHVSPDQVRIDREVYLGQPSAFADLRVTAPGSSPFFIDVKCATPRQTVVDRIAHKYGQGCALDGATQLLVFVDEDESPGDSSSLAHELQSRVASGLEVQVFGSKQLAARLGEQFDIALDSFEEERFHDIREAILRKKWLYSCANCPKPALEDVSLRDELLWKFAFWRVRELLEAGRSDPRSILRPGSYEDIAIVIVDMCSFSSFVRDTPDLALVRQCLTAYYSKARYEIINRGGMLDNFVGDMALGLFGVPDTRANYVEDALSAAKALSVVGDAVTDEWQRRIDRFQPSRGVHIGIALGTLQVVPLRPLSRTKSGVIADSINVASRLMSAAGPGEIAVSNAFYNRLSPASRRGMEPLEPFEGRNVGSLKAWALARSTR